MITVFLTSFFAWGVYEFLMQIVPLLFSKDDRTKKD